MLVLTDSPYHATSSQFDILRDILKTISPLSGNVACIALMSAMGPNVAGVIGSAVAAGVFIIMPD